MTPVARFLLDFWSFWGEETTSSIFLFFPAQHVFGGTGDAAVDSVLAGEQQLVGVDIAVGCWTATEAAILLGVVQNGSYVRLSEGIVTGGSSISIQPHVREELILTVPGT